MYTEKRKSEFFRLRLRLWGLITAAGSVAGAASVLGFFGSLHWLLDLCSHFRVQYFLGLSVVALLLLIPRKRGSAAVFGALAAANLGVILPLYFGRVSAPTSSGPTVRAMLVNVNTRYGHAASVAAALRRFRPDIVVLEEVNTKWLSDLTPVLTDYKYSEQELREDNFGIALFSRFPFTQSRIADIGDAEVPSIMAEIETRQGRCTLLATHPLPPGGREYSRWRNGQLAQVPRWVHRASSPLLLLGDLNVSPWSPHFRHLLRESGLRDSSQGRGVRPTWPTFSPLLLIPIDHCLYSPGIEIVNRETGPNVGSDHYPVVVDFLIGTPGIRTANQAPAVPWHAPRAASPSHQLP
jgi:endonuclease/exonuclease/phosphatase (EEP) superfamily protein YafD